MNKVFTTVRMPAQQRRRLEALAARAVYKRADKLNLSAAIRHALAVGIEKLETANMEVQLDERQ